MKEKMKKKYCGIFCLNMVDISRKTYKRKDVKTILDGNGTLWLNEKHIGERLGHKNLRSTTVKYHSDHKNVYMNYYMNQKNNPIQFSDTTN